MGRSVGAAASVAYLYHLLSTGEEPLSSPTAILGAYGLLQAMCALSAYGMYVNIPDAAPKAYASLQDAEGDTGDKTVQGDGVQDSEASEGASGEQRRQAGDSSELEGELSVLLPGFPRPASPGAAVS